MVSRCWGEDKYSCQATTEQRGHNYSILQFPTTGGRGMGSVMGNTETAYKLRRY